MYSNYRVFLNKLGFTGKQPIWNNYCTLKWCFFFSLHLKRHSHVLGVEIAKIATHLPTLGPHIILNNIISQNCMYCIMRFFNLVFSWINSTWTLDLHPKTIFKVKLIDKSLVTNVYILIVIKGSLNQKNKKIIFLFWINKFKF